MKTAIDRVNKLTLDGRELNKLCPITMHGAIDEMALVTKHFYWGMMMMHR